jgi:eukaryotic-like serine/threonine-protein kinase
MKSFLKYGVLFFLAFIITGSGAYFSILLVTDSAREIILPELKGKNIIYVLETLTRMGLNAKLRGIEYDDVLPRYHVLSQDPAPGAVIKKGRDVTITISKGQKEITIPDLRHLPLEQAGITLEQHELKKGTVSFAWSGTTLKNTVMAQYPEAFSPIFKGYSCDLLISLGPKREEYVMPDITGKNMSWALGFTEENNLELKTVGFRFSSLYEENTVLEQDPPPGSFVDLATGISIIVNRVDTPDTYDLKGFQGVIPVCWSVGPGFLNRHVRMNAFIFGFSMDLFNDHVPPGNEVCVLIPAGIQTKVDIFVDNELTETRHLDPWNKEKN